MFRTIIAGFAAVMIAGTAPAATTDPFTGFVGFGDSFSDKGRFGPLLQPPSNNGRFTDGITWMEMLGQAFADRGQGNFNMALGGATAGPTNTNQPLYAQVDLLTPRDPANPDDIPVSNLASLGQQVAAFANAGFASLVGNNPLVTILIGGNDILQAAVPDPVAIIGDILDGIQQVAAIDPTVFNSFMVATLPDFSIGPDLFGADPLVRATIRAQTIGFNTLLNTGLAGLAGVTGLEIEIFDMFAVTDSTYAEAQAAGLILDDACTASLTAQIIPDPSNNNCLFPGSSSQFLFLDETHPGDFAHSRWGAAALAQVEARLSPVPLPAGLPLMLIGLAGLGVVRMRRAPLGGV